MVKIVTDSVAAIDLEKARAMDVEVLTLYIHEGDTEYADASMDLAGFYSRLPVLIDNLPKSSQPSQFEFEEIFERAAREGQDLLGIFISSGLSSTPDAALRAARAVKARNIDFKYIIIDSFSVGFQEGYAVLDAVAARDAGEDLTGCAAAALASIERSNFIFAPETLTYLQKGGRIGKATSLLGNLIQLVPVLYMSDGKPDVLAKARTQKKALERIIAQLKEDIEVRGLRDLVVHYIGDPRAAKKWAKETIEPMLGRVVKVLPVSPVVGLHVGPAVGIVYQCIKPLSCKLSCAPESLMCAT